MAIIHKEGDFMGSNRCKCLFLSCLCLACFCLFACNDAGKKETTGRAIITDVEYNIRQTHEKSYVLDARGKIRNIGEVDLKNVVITGYCKSCILEFTSQHWFTSNIDKTKNQKDTISYLSVGAEEEFSFEEVAFYFTHVQTPPEKMPEEIEIVIESFDTVE